MNIPANIQEILDGSPIMAVSARAHVMQALNAEVPRNDLGLQKFFYRCDLIPENLAEYSAGEQAQILTAATVEIVYDEGYPTYINGSAVWAQMPMEPDEGFALFKQYLKQPETAGIRRLELLTAFPDEGQSGSESNPGQDLMWGMDEIQEFFHLYAWGQRAKAFDLFELAAMTKLRERRVMSTTDKHYLESERLLTKVMGYFERVNEETGDLEWIEELTPKVAIDMMEKLVRIQRTSLGLSAHGLAKADEHDAPPNASAEILLRQLAKQSIDPNGGNSTAASRGIEMLLNDPEAAEQAQNLIIRLAENK